MYISSVSLFLERYNSHDVHFESDMPARPPLTTTSYDLQVEIVNCVDNINIEGHEMILLIS